MRHPGVNPYLPLWEYVPDGEPHVFGDRVYLYGSHDRAAAQWSEEFQAEYLAEVIRQVFASPDLCGLAIWQFNDAKSYLRKGSNIRCKPLAQNLAGVFDQYRRPKLAAETVKKLFAEKK